MESDKMTLYGLNCRGRTECLRLMLALSGYKFIDQRMTLSEWRFLKENKNFANDAKLPILKFNETMIIGAMNIGQYLATEFGFYGKTPKEKTQIDAIIADIDKLHTNALPVIRSTLTKNFDKQKHYWQEFKQNHLIHFLQKYESILEQRLFLVGNRISWADLAVADALSTFSTCFDAFFLSSFLTLKAHALRAERLPNIRPYIAQRPNTTF